MKRIRHAHSAALPLVCLAFAVSAGCAADRGDEDAAAGALSTEPRVAILALGDAARVSCREAGQHYACGEADARKAASACGAGADYTFMTTAGTCRKNERLYPSFASCAAPVSGTCAFYAGCLEKALPCGESGYALGFGEKFCTGFRSTQLSEAGESWKASTMMCLQRAMVPRVKSAKVFTAAAASAATCSAVFDEAFATHPACYTDSRNSICALPASDLVRISSTIGFHEIVKSRTSSQALSVAGLCAKQILSRIFSFGNANKIAPSAGDVAESEAVRSELQEALGFWQAFDAE
jgi:hypothetical protein